MELNDEDTDGLLDRVSKNDGSEVSDADTDANMLDDALFDKVLDGVTEPNAVDVALPDCDAV
jgi:hypothetical protein